MTRQLAERELRGEDSAQWLVALERESATSEKDEVELGLGLANDLYRFWIVHGRVGKGSRCLGELLERAAPSDSLGPVLYTASLKKRRRRAPPMPRRAP